MWLKLKFFSRIHYLLLIRCIHLLLKKKVIIATEDSSILVNSYEARKPFGRGKGNAGTKNNSRFCTFYNRTNHIVEFCYQKHGYPNSFKPNSSVNASSNDYEDVRNATSAIDTSSSTGLTQEHYNHLVSLLQQS